MKKLLCALLALTLLCIAVAGCEKAQENTESDASAGSTSKGSHLSQAINDPISKPMEANSSRLPDSTSETSSYSPIPSLGEIPETVSEAVLAKGMLYSGIRTENGYYLSETKQTSAVVLYGTDGELVWKKDYPFGYQKGHVYQFGIAPAGNGFLLRAVYVTGEELRDAIPVVLHCDDAGEMLWECRYEDLLAGGIQKLFETESGEILTIGCAPTQKTASLQAPSVVCLSRLSPQGERIALRFPQKEATQKLGAVCYASGIGLIAGVRTGKADQADALLDKGSDALVIYDPETLAIKRSMPVDGEVLSILVRGERIYASTKAGIYTFDAQTGKQITHEAGKDLHLAAYGEAILLQTQNELRVMGTEDVFPFDGGTLLRVYATENGGYLALSEHIKDKLLPTPGGSRYKTELVYSGYDAQGELLWRVAYDMPEEN